jgi:hypothetical protein
MSDKTEANGDSPAPDPGAGPDNGAGPRQWPTREERLGLIRSYQADALGRTDPHVANLELIDGDVMLLALRMRESMEKQLLEGPGAGEGRRFEHQAETWLRCIRQIERNARIIWQLSRPAKGESGPA